MESMEKCSYLTHLQLYQRDHLVPGFPASLCCAALGRVRMIYKEVQEQGFL